MTLVGWLKSLGHGALAGLGFLIDFYLSPELPPITSCVVAFYLGRETAQHACKRKESGFKFWNWTPQTITDLALPLLVWAAAWSFLWT